MCGTWWYNKRDCYFKLLHFSPVVKYTSFYKIKTKHFRQTKKAGKTLAKNILEDNSVKRAIILGLIGGLAGGKTTFLQGLADGLGIREKILSPTFVIMRRYKIQNARYEIQNFYHIDCYRLKRPKEILDLGFKEIVSNSQNIVAVEWADRIRKFMPKNTIWIKFNFIDRNTRQIKYARD